MKKISITRERILKHGLDLMSKGGVAGVTVGVLAEEAGMSKSGLFAHFGSKDDIQIGILRHAAHVANEHVLAPAIQADEGLPRLEALFRNWLGWATRAGLSGGCPVAAGIFELDDIEGPVHDEILAMDSQWRSLLTEFVRQAINLGHFREDVDADQFVWELCGIYLSHHASMRLLRDSQADARAMTAFRALVARAVRV